MRLPRKISPGAAARRALLADLLIALVVALVALRLAAGVGVLGFVALLVLLALGAWLGIEATIRVLVAHRASRRKRRHPRPEPSSLRS